MCDDKIASKINAIPSSPNTVQKINVEIPANVTNSGKSSADKTIRLSIEWKYCTCNANEAELVAFMRVSDDIEV